MNKKFLSLFYLFLILESLVLISARPSKSMDSNNYPSLANNLSSPKILRTFPIPPSWWEISIHLKASGLYTIKEGKEPIQGKYFFLILWTGCMEEDMEDYIIYHETSKLLEWKAQEKVDSSGKIEVLSEQNFLAKPHFDFHYILRKGKELHFDFQVESFYVPHHDKEYELYLYLPASEENKMYPSEFSYNDYIINGSNRIFVVEKEIYAHQVEKTYQWSWKYQKWLKTQARTVFFSNEHQVKVKLSIIPHFAAR